MRRGFFCFWPFVSSPVVGRILGIDFGTRRVGLAVTDPLHLTVRGLTTVPLEDCIEYIDQYQREEPVERVVIGKPGKPGTAFARALKRFVRLLRERTPDIEIVFEDEDFTSGEALQMMRKAGIRKKDRQQKKNVDQVSAILILQRHLGLYNEML